MPCLAAGQEGKAVCVLATGDPLNFGIGKRLVERFGIDATEIVPTAGAFATFTAVLVVVTLTGFSISQLVAACSRTVERAIAVYMLVFVYALLLGGFIIERSQLPHDARWLVYTSFYYWGFGALVMNEFEGQPQVLRSLGFADGPGIWASVAILGGFFVALRVLAFVALWTTRH